MELKIYRVTFSGHGAFDVSTKIDNAKTVLEGFDTNTLVISKASRGTMVFNRNHLVSVAEILDPTPNQINEAWKLEE
jgi:hypothetical protein